MKSFTTFLLAAMLAALPQPLSAQLLPEQRVLDFQSLAALYAKRYAPADWKRRAFGFDLFDIKPWLDRVRAAQNDLEFFEIQAEYVASLNDTHAGFQMTSSFRANLGMTVDIYDGKVLIDSINRQLLPLARYPFTIGDEIVSVDSVSAEDWIKRISTWRKYGNPVSTRRLAAAQITFRNQVTFPRAIDIGESADVEIRRMSGSLERYTIPWNKAGLPVTFAGPVPLPRPALDAEQSKPEGLSPEPRFQNELSDLHNYKLPDYDLAWTYVAGVGSPVPLFRTGFPNFVQRLTGAVFHFSGTYSAGGLRIGYLRIPSFSPPSLTAAVNELRAEIEFFERNTDGLVVDVMRNPGGGCYMIDAAAALIPYPFYFFGEEIRATQDRLNSFQAQLELAVATRAEDWVIETYQLYVDKMKAALRANRGMTDPIAACRQLPQIGAPYMNDNAPVPVPYTRPLIVLIDEFSISAADIFPSMIQDNGRALLVGMRSSGGGGSVSGWPTGFYSESVSSNTNTLVVRKNPIVTSDFPAAPYVENIGARPDVPLDFMTRDNLVNAGRTFVDQFTQVLMREIQIKENESPFTVPNRGGISRITPGASGQTLVGYGRIKANAGSTTPDGLAIIGYRANNVLVTEAGVPAAPLTPSGRIYAEVDGTVNTGVAIANPNSAPATVSFYFTGANGNTGSGTVRVAAYGHIAGFLDQAPFNGTRPLNGTFTFSSSVPVGVTGIRSLTNERGEFLMSALPVSSITGTPASGTTVFPHFANGDGWATEIALVNPTDSVLAGTMQFLNQSGTPATLTIAGQTGNSFTYSIPARASQRFRTSGSAQPGQAGSVRVVPSGTDVSPSGLAILSFRKDGITVAHTGVPASATGSAFRLYAEAAGDFEGNAPGSTQTALAIANGSAAAATVTVEVSNLNGSPAGLTGAVTIPANGQVTAFLNQIPGLATLPRPFQGVIRISSSSPLSVLGLRGRYNERRDFLIAATPPLNESTMATNAELFFPHFAEAGGYTTQFILFSGSAGPLSGALNMFSQSGEPLRLPGSP